MIIDLDFHRRQKMAEERYDLVHQVNIVFDVCEDTKNWFGLHPDAILYTSSEELKQMMDSSKEHQITFCKMMQDYFGHFAKQLEKDSKKVQFVMNYYEEE
jgi:hypothetical protein